MNRKAMHKLKYQGTQEWGQGCNGAACGWSQVSQEQASCSSASDSAYWKPKHTHNSLPLKYFIIAHSS